MLRCYGCKKTFKFPSELTFHQNVLCKLVDNFEPKFECGNDGCNRNFSTARSLKQHILKIHFKQSRLTQSVSPVRLIAQLSPSVDPSLEPNTSKGENTPKPSVSTSPGEENINLKSLINTNLNAFMSKLYSHPFVPRNVVQLVVDGLEDLLSGPLKEAIKQEILHLCNLDVVERNRSLQSFISSNVLKKHRTEHLRFKNLESTGMFIRPREVVIGYRNEYRHASDKVTLRKTPCTMQLIPLRDVLQKLFSKVSVMADTLGHLASLSVIEDPYIAVTNVMQASCWKKIVRDIACNDPNELILPLILYCDDFEIGNPLGSHAGIHKLCGVYISFPCLPPHYSSKLSYLFLLALFHASDRLEFGNAVMFKEIISELNFLRANGIAINNKVFTGTLKFVVCSVSGDNLGLNGILGFVESFVAQHCCRICNVSKSNLHVLSTEDKTLLRNLKTYKEQLQLNDVSKTGIKESCVLLSLEGFDLFEHVATDVLHDWLEGCCRYVMNFIVNHFVRDFPALDVETLKARLVSFDYGPDSSSKPSNCIKLDSKTVTIKTSASEMLTLVRYFGLILGYYVPEGDRVWALFLLVRKITDRLLNSRVFPDTTAQFAHTISEFNELYISVTKSTLKPKFHFLTHYPPMMNRYGPLTQLWTMRFEGRHRISKLIANSTMTRVNICKTISIKNQLILNDLLLRDVQCPRFNFGKKVETNREIIANISSQCDIKTTNDTYYSVSWIKTAGTDIKKSSVVTVDICERVFLPVFASVEDIVTTTTDQIYLLVRYYKTMCFNEHLYAYEVEITDSVAWLRFNELINSFPNTLTVMSDSVIYVTLRHPVD